MSKNPDIYLLYEYMEKVPFAVRFKVLLDGEKIPYTVSDRHTRYLPKIELPTV